MSGHGAKLDHKREQAIVALLACPSVAEAAKQCGIAEVTLFRWLADTTFSAAYAEARRQCMQTALGALQQATGAAVTALVSIVGDSGAPTSSRVAAARAILENSFKAVEQMDIETRLQAIEAALAGQENKTK